MSKFKVAYQGIEGSYTHQALLNFAKKKKLEIHSIETEGYFKELFQKINKLGIGFIPIENSSAGSVVEVYDLLLNYNFEIIGEMTLEINHALLVKKGMKIKDVKKVYSHPQALAQSSHFISKHKFQKFSYDDTAGAAKLISKSKNLDEAAIGSEIAAKIYGLQILEKKIQNSGTNTTRFFMVKKKGKKLNFEKDLVKGANKTSIIIKTKDIPGALYKCLGAFATNDINLTKLESRPSQTKNFDYIFFIDFEGNLEDKKVQLALDEINFFAQKIKILGSYKKAN